MADHKKGGDGEKPGAQAGESRPGEKPVAGKGKAASGEKAVRDFATDNTDSTGKPSAPAGDEDTPAGENRKFPLASSSSSSKIASAAAGGAGNENSGQKEETTVNTRIVSPEQAAALRAGDNHPDSLVLLAGPHEFIGFCWPIEKSLVTAGRSRRLSDIVVPQAGVSKRHFQIERRDKKLFITDLKSTNYTWLNGQRLIPHQPELLSDNAQIKAGTVIFKFLARGHIELLSARHILNQAHIDSLTGSANRKALERRGPDYFREKENFCLILFDVDHFKNINDTYGHLAGDFVLQTVCEVTRGLIREGDMLFRYGGDEFCLLSASAQAEAKNIARRIRQAVETPSFKYEEREMKVTVSLGIADRRPEDKNWKDVYERADKAFYRAKRGGRNRLEAAFDKTS